MSPLILCNSEYSGKTCFPLIAKSTPIHNIFAGEYRGMSFTIRDTDRSVSIYDMDLMSLKTFWKENGKFPSNHPVYIPEIYKHIGVYIKTLIDEYF